MFKLDDNLLRELGLGELPPAEKNQMLRHIYETLEMRVGVTLAQQMSEAQLTEFESYITRNDEAGALKWLETNFPNYKQVVADELEKLKTEIKQHAPQIVAASQQAIAEAPAATQPPQPSAPQQPIAPAAAQQPVGSFAQSPQPAPAVQPPAPAGSPPQPSGPQVAPVDPLQNTTATPPQQQQSDVGGQQFADVPPPPPPAADPGTDSAQSDNNLPPQAA